MIDFAEIPEGIGPHEDRELELMLAGTKPLAMFSDAVGSSYEFPEADFAPYVADGTIVRREDLYLPPAPAVPILTVYFARAGEEWRIEAMQQIRQRLYIHREPTTCEIERQTGRLLGYSESEIEQYLEWVGLKDSGYR